MTWWYTHTHTCHSKSSKPQPERVGESLDFRDTLCPGNENTFFACTLVSGFLGPILLTPYLSLISQLKCLAMTFFLFLRMTQEFFNDLSICINIYRLKWIGQQMNLDWYFNIHLFSCSPLSRTCFNVSSKTANH